MHVYLNTSDEQNVCIGYSKNKQNKIFATSLTGDDIIKQSS